MNKLGVWDEFTGGFIEVDSDKLVRALKNLEFVKVENDETVTHPRRVGVKKPDYSWIRELDVCSREEREAWIRYFEVVDEVDGATDVNPSHYGFPGGVQAIDIARHLPYPEGIVVKYVCRAGRKGDRLTDLKKAEKYLQWAIENEGKLENNDQ